MFPSAKEMNELLHSILKAQRNNPVSFSLT